MFVLLVNNYIAIVLPVSHHVILSLQIKVTQKVLAVVVPVASVDVVLKFVPHVSVKLEVPNVVIMNVTLFPAIPPTALNVHAPLGVMVMPVM